MGFNFVVNIFNNFVNDTMNTIEIMGPKVLAVVIMMVFGTIISYGVYKLTLYVFKKFHIVDFIDRIWSGFEEHTTGLVDESGEKNKKDPKKEAKKIRYDTITAKSFAYYIFLLFFRWAVVFLGINEVENFMQDLIAYLPSLFI